MRVIQVYAPTNNAKEDNVEQFHEDLKDLIDKNQEMCSFHHRGLGSKSRNSRYTFSNGQVWPWSTNEAGKRLTEFCQEKTLVTANTLFQQHKRRLYTWTSPDAQHRLCRQRWRSSIQSAKTRTGADCGSDHDLLFGKFKLKLKKLGKITRPFRYD